MWEWKLYHILVVHKPLKHGTVVDSLSVPLGPVPRHPWSGAVVGLMHFRVLVFSPIPQFTLQGPQLLQGPHRGFLHDAQHKSCATWRSSHTVGFAVIKFSQVVASLSSVHVAKKSSKKWFIESINSKWFTKEIKPSVSGLWVPRVNRKIFQPTTDRVPMILFRLVLQWADILRYVTQ